MDKVQSKLGKVSRRAALVGAAGGLLAMGASCQRLGRLLPAKSLATAAAERGISFGNAVTGRHLGSRRYRALLEHKSRVIVAENALKWKYLEPDEEEREWGEARDIIRFAHSISQPMRGHCFIWNHDDRMPDWLVRQFNSRRASRPRSLLQRMEQHVRFLKSNFDDVVSWDVVNEAIDPSTGRLRNAMPGRLLGNRLLDASFNMMRDKFPTAQLVYNENMSWERSSAHRNGVLRLLEGALGRSVPIQALGIQSHLAKTLCRERDEADWYRFLREVEGMGIDIILSELDCGDQNLEHSDPARRDEEVAAFTKGYLDLTLSFTNVRQIILWSLTDRYSYMNRDSFPEHRRRRDGQAVRGHPYDENFRPKPMRDALLAALAAAPLR